MAKHFWKAQTVGSYFPPIIRGRAEGNHVYLTAESGYSNDADAPLQFRVRRDVHLSLTSHEAMALAAWLSEQAERITRKAALAAARKAARKAARAAAKGGKP